MDKFLGQKINTLTVIDTIPSYKNSRGYIYICKCDCGKEQEYNSIYYSIYCKFCTTIAAHKSLEGVRKGYWTCIQDNFEEKNKSRIKVRCDCGFEQMFVRAYYKNMPDHSNRRCKTCRLMIMPSRTINILPSDPDMEDIEFIARYYEHKKKSM